MKSQRTIRHVIPNRSALLTAERVPSEKNILEASEVLSLSVALESPIATTAAAAEAALSLVEFQVLRRMQEMRGPIMSL